MKSDLFQEARRRVSARQAAERWGFAPNRGGFIACPFHRERTPSLKLYDSGGWHCFGCGAGGSAIDFTARLFGLTPLEAVRRLDEAFRLGLPLDGPPDPARRAAARQRRALAETQDAFEAWRDGLLDRLCAALRTGHEALRDCAALDRLTDAQALAVRERARLEHLADTLTGGTMAEQMEIFRERRQMQCFIERILSPTPARSNRA